MKNYFKQIWCRMFHNHPMYIVMSYSFTTTATNTSTQTITIPPVQLGNEKNAKQYKPKFDIYELKTIRKQMGWSQEKLSAKSGVGVKTISKFEKTPDLVPLDKVFAIAEALGMNMSLPRFKDIPGSKNKIV